MERDYPANAKMEVGDHKCGYLSSADIALVQGRVAVLELYTDVVLIEDVVKGVMGFEDVFYHEGDTWFKDE
ncbi:hypothetical protein ACFX14_043970 [Malus domestica]